MPNSPYDRPSIIVLLHCYDGTIKRLTFQRMIGHSEPMPVRVAGMKALGDGTGRLLRQVFSFDVHDIAEDIYHYQQTAEHLVGC